MLDASRQTRRRRQALRGLLALAESFEETFTCDPGDEHTEQVLHDYIEQRAVLMELFAQGQDQTLNPDERVIMEELRVRDQHIQEMLQTQRDKLRVELRQVKQQKRAIQGYKQAPQGSPKLTVKG